MEGPEVRIAAEDIAGFRGRLIRKACGNAKIDMGQIEGKTIKDIFSRGKQLLLDLGEFHIRVHFMMFGSYRVNEERGDWKPRLALDLENGKVRFYNCSVRLVDGRLKEPAYDPEIDITGNLWNPRRVLSLVAGRGSEEICDVLMDQEIFAGVGNMIKNEALYLARVHPLSRTSAIPQAKMEELLGHTRAFSMKLLGAERRGQGIRGIFDVYRLRKCGSCGGKISMKKTGRRNRLSFFCPICQILYG
jgi:endonuclease-8